ncbi:MAG: DUF881 domain-containing protein [Clostridia bacterium]|nr:DUF881 domain-containing protein [Clostridia bacterium]
MNKYGWTGWVALGCLIAGFLIMTQFKAQQNIIGKNPAAMRADDLVGTMIQVEQANDLLEREKSGLSQQLRKYQQGQSANKLILDELAQTKVRAGLEPVEGPGMEVVLADSQGPREEGVDPNNYYIHESFLREIVNAFWTGGAEAIAINNLRLNTLSEIFCGGTTIFTNKELISPPYLIQAIGDSNNLRTSLNMDVLPFLSSLQKEYGIKLEVKDQAKIRLPGRPETLELKYAKPLR